MKVSYILFLGLFSYVILCNFYPIDNDVQHPARLQNSQTVFEIILIIWVFDFFLSKIKQVFFQIIILSYENIKNITLLNNFVLKDSI